MRAPSSVRVWKAERDGVVSAIQAAVGKGKPVEPLRDKLTRLEENQPQPSRVPKLLRGDDTPESLAWSLSHFWPSAGVLTAEAGAILGSQPTGLKPITSEIFQLSIIQQANGRANRLRFCSKTVRLP